MCAHLDFCWELAFTPKVISAVLWSCTCNSRQGGSASYFISAANCTLYTLTVQTSMITHYSKGCNYCQGWAVQKINWLKAIVQKVFLRAQHAGFLYSCNSENDKGLIYQRAAQWLYGNLKATCYGTNAPIYLCPFIKYYLQLLFPGAPTIEYPTSTVIRPPFIFSVCQRTAQWPSFSYGVLVPILSYCGLST